MITAYNLNISVSCLRVIQHSILVLCGIVFKITWCMMSRVWHFVSIMHEAHYNIILLAIHISTVCWNSAVHICMHFKSINNNLQILKWYLGVWTFIYRTYYAVWSKLIMRLGSGQLSIQDLMLYKAHYVTMPGPFSEAMTVYYTNHYTSLTTSIMMCKLL